MFRTIPLGESYHLINHGPVVMVTSGDRRKANVAPIAWTTPLDDEPPLVGIVTARSHHTARLIKRTKSFVINVPRAGMLKALKFCGSVSGRKVDKFSRAGLALEGGKKVKTPHLKDAAGYLECKLKKLIPLPGVYLCVGRVLLAAADPSIYTHGSWTPQARTFHHLGGGNFALTGRRLTK